MEVTTIMYLHESVNRKALRARNSFYGLTALHQSFCTNWTIFVGVFYEKPHKIGSK